MIVSILVLLALQSGARTNDVYILEVRMFMNLNLVSNTPVMLIRLMTCRTPMSLSEDYWTPGLRL